MQFSLLAIGLAMAVNAQAVSGPSPQVNAAGQEIGNRANPVNFPQSTANESAFKKATLAANERLKKRTPLSENADLGDEKASVFWQKNVLGTGIGAAGVAVDEFLSNGAKQIILGSGSGYGANFKISMIDTLNQKFDVIKQLSLEQNIVKLKSYTTDDGQKHLLVLGVDGVFFSVNPSDLTLIEATTLPQIATDFDVVKVEGEWRIVVKYDTRLVLLNPTDFTEIAQASVTNTDSYYNRHIVTGAFLEKDSLAVVSQGGDVYSLTAQSVALEKTVNTSLARQMQALDITGDGLDEIIVAKDWYEVFAFDVLQDGKYWSHATDLNVDKLGIYDVNQDGKLDVLYGDAQWGDLHAIDSKTGERFWQINNPEHGVASLHVEDIDKDNQLEIMWGAGHSSSGADYYYVHDVETKALEWQSEDLVPPFVGDIAEQSGDLIAAVSSSESDSGYGSGLIEVVNLFTKATLWKSTQADMPHTWTGVHALILADVDSDVGQEVIVGTDYLYDGRVYIFDASTGQKKHSIELQDGSPISVLDAYDVDGDGIKEIIIANTKEHTGSDGANVQIIDGQTGFVDKQSPMVTQGWEGIVAIHTTQRSQDNAPHVFMIAENQLLAYDTDTGLLKTLSQNSTNGGVNLLSVTSTQMQGEERIIVSDTNGKIHYLNDEAELVFIADVCNSQITGLSSPRAGEVGFVCESAFGAFHVEAETMLWQQENNDYITQKLATYAKGDENYYAVGASNFTVYAQGIVMPEFNLPDVEVTSHFNKSVTGNVTSTIDVDMYRVESTQTLGELVFSETSLGEFTYTPHGTATGEETILYKALKNGLESDTASITVTITNEAPVANDMALSGHWASPLNFMLNASDANNDDLTFTLVESVTEGELSLDSETSGNISYLFSGENLNSVTFTYKVSDGLAETTPSTVTLTPTNTTPTVTSAQYNLAHANATTQTLAASDADGDTLSFAITTQPEKGDLTFDEQTGEYTYTPAGDEAYAATFEFTASDGVSVSDTGSVKFTVAAKPAAKSSEGTSGSQNTAENASSGGALYGLLALVCAAGLRKRKRIM